MAATTKLTLPFLDAAQSQKHVTHNDALNALDALVQISLKGIFTNAPPGSPAAGDRYITGGTPTGAWAGQTYKLAVYQDGVWKFFAPQTGWTAFDETGGGCVVYNGSNWIAITGTVLNLSQLGIQGTPDATNRVLAKTTAVLFTYDDVSGSGTGDMRMTINKQTAAKDASQVFQDGYSTRATLGLLGDDEFSVKLTPDATNFYRTLRGWKDLHGRVDIKQAMRKQSAVWTPKYGGTTLDSVGINPTTVGTLSSPALASSALFTQSPRMKIASAAAVGSAAEVFGSALCCWRGNAAGFGGFYVKMRGGIETFQAASRMFFGLYSAASAIGNVNPSTLLNMIGIGFDSGDTTLQFMTNDGTGTATKTNLGANFPVTGGWDLYELILSAEPNDTVIKYRVERLNSGDVATGTVTTDLPVNTGFLTPHMWYNNGTSAGACELSIVDMYMEFGSLLGSRGAL